MLVGGRPKVSQPAPVRPLARAQGGTAKHFSSVPVLLQESFALLFIKCSLVATDEVLKSLGVPRMFVQHLRSRFTNSAAKYIPFRSCAEIAEDADH